jgi:hypothetical protein
MQWEINLDWVDTFLSSMDPSALVSKAFPGYVIAPECNCARANEVDDEDRCQAASGCMADVAELTLSGTTPATLSTEYTANCTDLSSLSNATCHSWATRQSDFRGRDWFQSALTKRTPSGAKTWGPRGPVSDSLCGSPVALAVRNGL